MYNVDTKVMIYLDILENIEYIMCSAKILTECLGKMLPN